MIPKAYLYFLYGIGIYITVVVILNEFFITRVNPIIKALIDIGLFVLFMAVFNRMGKKIAK